MMAKRWGIYLGALGLVLSAACSSKTDTGDTIGHNDQNTNGGGSSVGGAGNGSGGFDCQLGCATGGAGNGMNQGGSGLIGAQGGACGGEYRKAEAEPVDMYIMFDQSSSMGDPLPDNSTTWWAAAQGALINFVNSPQAVGMTVGIQYFPLNGTAPASCTAAYGTPDVELGALPGNSAALVTSIQNHAPSAFTPTAPALTGAINHMKAWAPSHPGHAPVVVFVTDGFPTECDPQQISDIALIAKTAFETDPPVRTFVVGFNLAVGGENLNQIASAGGTGKAFLISNGDIGTAFVNAMLGITGTPLQCNFDLPKPPDGQVLDKEQVQVNFTPSATQVTVQIPKMPNGLSDCAANQDNGWYYDAPNAPTKIFVCPGTCAKFSAGVVGTTYGCKPDVGIPK